jgi:hypothetical protein
VITSDGYTVPNACFNPNLIQPMNKLCGIENNYLAQVPVAYIPSFIDLRGNYSLNHLVEEGFSTLISSALQRIGVTGKGKEKRILYKT